MIILSRASQTKKGKCHIFSCLWVLVLNFRYVSFIWNSHRRKPVRAHVGRGGFQGEEREHSGIKVYLKWYRIIGQYSLNGEVDRRAR